MPGVLVIGKSGQLAQAIAHLGASEVRCAGRDEADLRDRDALAATLERYSPRAVINAGAYTSVDGAQSEPDLCWQLNVDGPLALGELCAGREIPLLHLSTDCVFDGRKSTPYTPGDVPAPLDVYGKTKLEGEVAVRAVAPKSLIVRVSWIFSQFGGNFVSTMLRLAETRETVSVVCDQLGCPTYAPALAKALLEMAGQASCADFSNWGTYHLAGSGETNRAAMAQQIFAESRRHGGPSAEVVPIATADYPTPARRPLNARLDMADTERVFGVTLPDWREGLADTVPILLRAKGSQ